MLTKEGVLARIRGLSQEDLKWVIAESVPLIDNPGLGIGTNLWLALFHIVPQPCVELIIVDKIGTPGKILITRRAENNPTHAGQLHCPGTYIRRGETNDMAMRRCIKRELGLGVEITDHRFATQYNNPTGCAGDEKPGDKPRHTIGLVYLVQISGSPTSNVQHKWTDFIPADVLPAHQKFLNEALGWEITNRKLFE